MGCHLSQNVMHVVSTIFYIYWKSKVYIGSPIYILDIRYVFQGNQLRSIRGMHLS